MRYASMLMLALLIVAGPGAGWAEAQTTWRVPSVIASIATAVDTASAGDLVLVSNNQGQGNPPYAAFTMKAGVRVAADTGQAPRISGSGAAYAVEFPLDADEDTILEGFAEITEGSAGCVYLEGAGIVRGCAVRSLVAGVRSGVEAYGGLVDGCVVEVRDGWGVIAGGSVALTGSEVGMWGGTGVLVLGDGVATVTGCSIVGGDYGINVSGARAVISGCTVRYQSGVGIHVGATSGGTPSEVTDNLVVSGDMEAIGILVYTPFQETVVSRNTLDGWGTGIQVSSLGSLGAIEGNLVVNAAEIGIDCNGQSVSLNCNDAYNNGPNGVENYDQACSRTPRNYELDPLFCAGRVAGLEDYTLRIDSPCTASYSTCSGGIGARGVECAWGTLARTTTVAADQEILVIEDLTVPSTRSLTLGSGVTFTMNNDDLGESGSDEDRVELIVDGDLVVEGEEENRVAIKGATEAVGSWWGIDVGSSGTIAMENADLSHAQYPLLISAADLSSVTGCTFQEYEITALTIGSGDGMDLTVEGNTIYSVDGTTGIQLVSNVNGVTLEGNRVWGDEPMLAGITTFMPAGAPLLAANEVSGFTVSEGITLTGGSPDLVENEVTGNFTGILVTGGTPRIGIGSDSDNAISGNEDGIVITGGVPVIRNNQITDNVSWGVRVQNDANPNLGVYGSPGLNTFLDNYSGCIINENPGGTPVVNARGNYFDVCHGSYPVICWSGPVDYDGWACEQPASRRRPGVTRVEDGLGFVLAGARPNPMTTTGGIAFRLDGEGRMVGARVFDVAGRMVREIAGRPYDPGDHVLAWDGLSDEGRPVRTGMYFVRVTVGDEPTGTVKVLVAR